MSRIQYIRLFLLQLRESAIVRNSSLLLNSFAIRLVVQSLYFVILARTFSTDKYGAFLGAIALISLVIPFASWGSSRVLIQQVSREPSCFPVYYGTTILKTLVFGSGLTATILLCLNWYPIPGISIESVFFLAIANLILMPLSDNCRDAFTSVGRLDYTSKVILSVSINRFLGLLALVILVKTPTLFLWSIVYCIATLVAAIYSSISVAQIIGLPQFQLSRVVQEQQQGFAFAISDSAENLYNDLDKSMLTKLSTVESVAIYGASYHILNVSLMPVQAMMLATFRNFFQAGAVGIQACFAFCQKLLPVAVGYALLSIAAIFLFSPIIPTILGEAYRESILCLMWLSPTILFKVLHRFAADILTGSNYQKLRSISQVAIGLLNGLLNLWLIPRYHWLGAIWATLASEFSLMLLLWGFVYWYLAKERARSMLPKSLDSGGL